METPNENDIPKPVPVEMSLAGPDRPEITRFLHVRRALSPSLSPDGTRIAFRSSISGKPQLWVAGAGGGWPDQLTYGESVTFHEWSPAGNWILYGTDRSGNEREGYYLIHPEGTLERELLPPTDAFRVFGGFTPDGKTIAYATTGRSQTEFDIHALDVESGEDRMIFRGRMGLYAVSWRPDGRSLILIEARGEDGNDVFLLDIATGQIQVLFQPEEPSWHASFSWKPDGSGFYLTTNEGRNFNALAYFDPGSRELTFMATPEHDAEQVCLSHDGRWLAWVTNEEAASILHLLDLATGGEAAPPEIPRGIYTIRWAARAAVASISVTSPSIPGDIWTWSPETGQVFRATRSASGGLDLMAMVSPEHARFEARDGETLYGLLYMPTGIGADEKPPVLLSIHGGPTAQARPAFDPVHQYLLTRGVAIFDLNYRGSTGYGKRFARLDNLRLRPNAVRDMADALDWLSRRGGVDTTRAAVMGGSYGGFMTLAALTTFPNHFRAGVALVGVSNWVTALEGASPELKASDRLEYGDIDDPDDREFFRELSPITHVKRVRSPLMVVHGANDPRDPVTESDQFVRAVREMGIEVEYLRFPDEGHGIRNLENRIIAYRRVADFLERRLLR